MQWNKASKKTRNIADETIASAPEISAGTEGTPKPRNTRSSKPKKAETTESGAVNHHHKATPVTAEKKVGAEVSGPSRSSILDPVGVVTPARDSETVHAMTAVAGSPVSHEEVARLAYTYWIARGYSHGSAEEDWLRAEQELKSRR